MQEGTCKDINDRHNVHNLLAVVKIMPERKNTHLFSAVIKERFKVAYIN